MRHGKALKRTVLPIFRGHSLSLMFKQLKENYVQFPGDNNSCKNSILFSDSGAIVRPVTGTHELVAPLLGSNAPTLRSHRRY